MKRINRRWDKIKKTLRSRRGESIMEALVSLMILGILMTTIVATIRFSMVLTGDSLNKADIAQEGFNELILGDYDDEADIRFSSDDITATHPVYYHNEGNTIAFQFRPTGP